MVKIKYLFYLIVLTTILVACKATYASLTYSRKEYNGTEMRTDGYYFKSISDIRDTNQIISAVSFFRNGVFSKIEGYKYPTSNIDVEEFIDSIAHIDIKLQAGRGIFLIKENELIVEYWTYASHNPKPTGILKGKILNDSTINISLFGDNGLWHFKQYSIKTDSIFTLIN
jgi:hypothetical protein